MNCLYLFYHLPQNIQSDIFYMKESQFINGNVYSYKENKKQHDNSTKS